MLSPRAPPRPAPPAAADLYLHPFITSNVQLEQWKTLHPKMQRGSREGPGQSGLLRDDLRCVGCNAIVNAWQALGPTAHGRG